MAARFSYKDMDSSRLPVKLYEGTITKANRPRWPHSRGHHHLPIPPRKRRPSSILLRQEQWRGNSRPKSHPRK